MVLHGVFCCTNTIGKEVICMYAMVMKSRLKHINSISLQWLKWAMKEGSQETLNKWILFRNMCYFTAKTNAMNRKGITYHILYQ